jgi:hypothetical protein
LKIEATGQLKIVHLLLSQFLPQFPMTLYGDFALILVYTTVSLGKFVEEMKIFTDITFGGPHRIK